MNCYVDSSVVLRYLLLGDSSFKQTSTFEKTGSSELLFIECSRVMERYRLENLISDEQLAEVRQKLELVIKCMYTLELTGWVKKRAAGPFPTVVSTLDSFHLASALLWNEHDGDLLLFTFDKQMLTCAAALGIGLFDAPCRR